jgi:hypothetical protein
MDSLRPQITADNLLGLYASILIAFQGKVTVQDGFAGIHLCMQLTCLLSPQ